MAKTIFVPREPGEITPEDILTLKLICSTPTALGLAILLHGGLQFSAVACALAGGVTTLTSIALWLPRKPNAPRVTALPTVSPRALPTALNGVAQGVKHGVKHGVSHGVTGC